MSDNGSGVWDSVQLDIDNLNDLDEKIRKKVEISKHIASTRIPSEIISKQEEENDDFFVDEENVFIDKFMYSISASFFRFSNKSIQVKNRKKKMKTQYLIFWLICFFRLISMMDLNWLCQADTNLFIFSIPKIIWFVEENWNWFRNNNQIQRWLKNYNKREKY